MGGGSEWLIDGELEMNDGEEGVIMVGAASTKWLIPHTL